MQIKPAIGFEIEGWDWNCPQHIPTRYSVTEVAAIQARSQELERQLVAQNF